MTKYWIPLVFLAALIVNPWSYDMFELPKNQFVIAFFFVTTILVAAKYLLSGGIQFKYSKGATILLLLWLLTLSISTIFSIAPELSFYGSYLRWQGMYSFLIYAGFFLIFLNFLPQKKEQEGVLKFLIAIASITAIHAILQQFGIGTFTLTAMDDTLGRSFATLGHPNFLGQFLLLPIWASIYFTITQKRKIFIPITGLLTAALLLTQNRASILALVISGVFFAIITVKDRAHRRILYLALSTAVLMMIILFSGELRFVFTRLYLWEGAIKVLEDYPVFGAGLETFQITFQKVADPALFEYERLFSIADRAHNEYLDVLVTTGRFGFAALMAIIFTTLSLKPTTIFSKTLFAAFIAIIITIFFSFSLTIHYLVFALVLALLVVNTCEFETVRLKRNVVGIALVGVTIFISIFGIINAAKVTCSDIKLKEGDLVSAANLNPHQNEIYLRMSEILINAGKYEEAKLPTQYAGEFTNFSGPLYYLQMAKIEGVSTVRKHMSSHQ